MLENQYRMTLSQKTLQLISQIPIEGSENICCLSQTLDAVSLLLDTAASEHEIWMLIALMNNLEMVDDIAPCELETLKVARELLDNPTSHEKVINETALYLTAAIVTVKTKKLAGLFDGGSSVTLRWIHNEFERLSLYKTLVKRTRLYPRYHRYLKIILTFSNIEPKEFLEERKIFAMIGARSNAEHMGRIEEMALVAGIPVAHRGEDIFLSEFISEEKLLEHFLLLVHAHFPSVTIRRADIAYADLQWKRRHLTIQDKIAICRRIAFRENLMSPHFTDAVFKQFNSLLPRNKAELDSH